MSDLLDARHVVASAAGTIARVSAQISRALAWQPEPDQGAAFIADLENAVGNLRAADRELQEAIVRTRVALAAKEGDAS